MKFAYDDPDMKRLASDASFNGEFAAEIVKAYRKRMQQVSSASDQRDLIAIRSLRFEKLKGDRSHQYSIRLNRQWRLIFEIENASDESVIHIVGIEDYH